MRLSPLFPVAALMLGACAPAGTVARAPSAPPAPPTTSPAPSPVPAPEPDEVLAAAPEHWWLLDEATDRVHGTSVERAYQELLAQKRPQRTVVVAIIDSGVDVEHEDLDDNVWVNQDEVPGNGRDDDGNGYVDDVHGWNFIGGPDGRNVDKDTYEVARLAALCRAGGRAAAGAPLSISRDAEQCRKIEAELEEERAETEEMLQQIRGMSAAMQQFTAMLKAQLGVDSLTTELVAGMRPTQPALWRAQQAYLQLAEHGVTPAVLQEEQERLEGKLEFGLNPDFDPRPIVGDDYTNLSERSYGNPNVEGPDARHGTHVAGIVAAERGNGVGVDGIAPAVRIMSLRAVPDGDERDKDVANAIRYAVDNGAQIINMSFGKAYSPHKQVVDEAVRYADSKGVLIVHAAGNDAADVDAEPSYPTRYLSNGATPKNWIEVGASSWQGPGKLAAAFSNYGGRTVDVFAPGVDIRSTIPDNRYEDLQGTSMAAPVVSGLAALIMAYYPELSAEEVRRVILESATEYEEQLVVRPGSEDERVRFGELSSTGGVVNAYGALRMAEQLAAQNGR